MIKIGVVDMSKYDINKKEQMSEYIKIKNKENNVAKVLFSDEKDWEDELSKIKINDNPSPPSSIPPYEPQLSQNMQGMHQTLFDTLDPIDVDESILDIEIKELEKMSISSIRTLLIDEIESLEDETEEKRKAQLQKIFNRLLELQPSWLMRLSDSERFLKEEQRLYIDLISTPELYQTPFVRKFLKEDFFVSYANRYKKNMLLEIYNYYDNHSKEAIEKFNYILRSSDGVGSIILDGNIDLETFFNEDVMLAFRKEDLSQLFRFYFERPSVRSYLESLFCPENHKSLFIISQLTKKVNSLTGHSAEFLDNAWSMFVCESDHDRFVTLLEDIYDKVVRGKENELKFSKEYLDSDNFAVMQELINYIVMKKYDSSLECKELENAINLESFLSGFNRFRNLNHEYVLGKEGLYKFNFHSDIFDPSCDFRAIENDLELEEFKKGMLYNIYGISLKEAEHIHDSYCRYMDALEKGIIEEDRSIFEMLKAIDSIYTLKNDDPDFKDKLHVLQNAYYNHISEKGLTKQKSTASAIIVEGLLNRMFMNTYNKRLTQITNESKVLKYDRNVKIVDAGLDFEMIVTALYGVTNFYDSDVNMASKWNTAANSRNQGICASYISSRNLGVISLISPILGFNHIPKDSLNIMGSSDVFTQVKAYNLRHDNNSNDGENRCFIPGNIMQHETRYGYNELLIDRFLMDDKDGKMKLQPDYVLFYKFGDNYETSNNYLQSRKLAEDFGIPIVLVDIPKLKENEKNTILKMEEELFSSEFSEEKLSAIVTRYMDNYTGSLTFAGEMCYIDFSIVEMERFFDKIFEHIDSIEDLTLRARWIDALKNVYKEELGKYDDARQVQDYNYSVRYFVLDDKYNVGMRLTQRIFDLNNDLEKEESIDCLDKTDDEAKDLLPEVKYNGKKYIFTTSQSISSELKALIDLAEYLQVGSKFETVEYSHNEVSGVLIRDEVSDDLEKVLIENILSSYLIGSYEFSPLLYNSNIYTRRPIVDFEGDIETKFNSSPYLMCLQKNDINYIGLSKSKVDLFVDKLEEMSEEKFLSIFSPVIEKHSHIMGQSYEDVASKLLERKNGARDMFDSLGNKFGYNDSTNKKAK